MILFISFITFVATIIGGLVAMRFSDRLHLILGFSAGAVLGVALFDLIPESMELLTSVTSLTPSNIMLYVAAGFFGFMLIDRFAFPHTHDAHDHSDDDHCEREDHAALSTSRGVLGAASLSVHSFIDGLAIGFSYHVSPTLAFVVAAAVIAHDFSDGLNTVSFILKNKGGKKSAWLWLIGDALAPVLGIMVASFFIISEAQLGILLALFSGFFLYLGASDLLPESHHAHPAAWTTISTLLGAGLMYGIISIAG